MKKYKKWIYMVLTALGVGMGSAAHCAGCESGWVDDTTGECIVLDKGN